MNILPSYETRFIKACEVNELLSYWRTARIPCPSSRYDRMLKAVEWFKKKHPEYSETAVYKDLCGLLENY